MTDDLRALVDRLRENLYTPTLCREAADALERQAKENDYLATQMFQARGELEGARAELAEAREKWAESSGGHINALERVEELECELAELKEQT